MDPTLLISLLLAAISRASAIGELITRTRAEGRDVSPEELDALAAEDSAARGKLVEAIAARRKAEAGGPKLE